MRRASAKAELGLSGVLFMASPQKENGYTPIANELLDAFCALHLSGNEWKVVHTVIRKTYGYQKKSDWIATSQITELTGLPKQRINEAKKKLLSMGVLHQDGLLLSLNKDYEQWGKVTEKRYQSGNGKALPSNGKALQKVTENRPHKRKKENKQKKHGGVLLKDMTNPNLIAEVIKNFERVDAKNKTYYNNTSQRAAAAFLIEEYGLAEVIARINFLPKSNTMQYFPVITTPCQLRDKWVQLETAAQRYKQEKTIKPNIAF